MRDRIVQMQRTWKQIVTETCGVANLRLRIAVLIAIVALAVASQAIAQPGTPKFSDVDGPRTTPLKRGLRLASSNARLEDGDSPAAMLDPLVVPSADEAIPLAEPIPDSISNNSPEEVEAPSQALQPEGPPVADGPAWNGDYWQSEDEPPAATCTSGTWFNRGRWYARQDFVYLTRYSMDTRRLIADSSQFRPTTFEPEDVATTGRTLGFEPGGRLTLGRFLCRDGKNRDHSIEFQFFGLLDWQISSGMTARSTDSLFTPIDTYALDSEAVGGFNGTQVQKYIYDASFDNYELNYVISQRLGRDRLELTPEGEWVRKLTSKHTSTLFAGVRVIEIGEGFLWTSEAAVPATNNGRYEVTTQNQMLGLQFGHELVVQRSKFRVGVRNQVAGLINYADQKSFVHIVDTRPEVPVDDIRVQSGSSHDMSFLYGMSIMAACHLRPNLAIRTGYEFMYLNQLALAPEQLTFAPPPTRSQIVNGGALIFNGFSLGLEMVW